MAMTIRNFLYILGAVVLAGGLAWFIFNVLIPTPAPVCDEIWSCAEWSVCAQGEQARSCVDANACGTTKDKPVTVRSCVTPAVCGNNLCEAGETCGTCSKDCGICKPKTCVEDWSCGSWSSCLGGAQTRTCVDGNTCGSAANRPPESQSCTVGQCTETWSCGNWSQCSQGSQTRSCSDTSSCGTNLNKPPVSQSCTNTCTENWSCGGWGTCTNGSQSRTCTDLNICGTNLNKPPVSQSCTNAPPADTTPPAITGFNLSPGDAAVIISYSGSDQGSPSSPPVQYVIIRGVSQSAVNAVLSSNFENPGSGVSIALSNTTQSGSFNDTGLSNGTTYWYRLRVCDSAAAPNCATNQAQSATPTSSPPPPLPIVSISSSDTSASEAGSDPATLRLSRTGSTSAPLSANLTISGSATNGGSNADYQSIAIVHTIPAGSAFIDIPFLPVDDTAVEGPESATFEISANALYSIASPNLVTITITDNDSNPPPPPPPTPDVSVSMPDSSAGEPSNNGTFRITRSIVSTSALPVTISFSGSTATAGSDYQTISTTQTIPANATTLDIPVTIINDTAVEGSENLVLTVSSGAGYNIGSPSSQTMVITDDDSAPPPTPDVSVTLIDASIGEPSNNGTFRITRSVVSTSALPVTISFSGSTATAGSDYQTISTTQTIPANATTLDVPLTVIDDSSFEGSETVSFSIVAGSGYNVISPSSQSATIADDDFGPITVSVDTGAIATVMDYPADACDTDVDEWDLPDVVPHAVKMPNGELVLESGNAPKNYFMFGTNFNNLTRSCTSVLDSPVYNAADPNTPYHIPESYNHQKWITSVYRVGQVIYGLVHNEYHDPRAASAPPCQTGKVTPGNPCWYNSIGLAASVDGGHTFTERVAPGHVIAMPHVVWDPFAYPKTHTGGFNAPIHGYMEPSSIIKRNENGTDYYYAFIAAFLMPNGSSSGACLMRTSNLANPGSWRAWDGTGFNLPFSNPYTSGGPTTPCSFIDLQDIGGLHQSLTFNTYLNKYLLVGMDHMGTAASCGVYYSVSDDLINWSPRKQILNKATGAPWTAALPHNPCSPSNMSNSYGYSSVIDHNQLNDPTDPNFEKSGTQPHLYIVHFQDGAQGLNRDLKRMPLTICQAGKSGPGCP